MDHSVLNDIWARVNRELWVVTAAAPQGRGGLIATFVNQASIVPQMPRALIGIARQHFTWELIQASGSFGLHLLGEEHLEWVWRFGTNSGRTSDKLAGLTLTTGVTGAPLLTDALAWIDCRVETSLDTGDRTIFLGAVVDAARRSDAAPLTASRMVQLAPPEKLQLLRQQFEHDGSIDARAIADWRRAASS